MAHIMVIDDDEQLQVLISEALTRAKHTVTVLKHGEMAVESNKSNPVDLLITDIFMPEKDGLETIRDFQKEFPATKIVAITGGMTKGGEYDYLEHAKAFGAERVFRKPIRIKDLISALEELL